MFRQVLQCGYSVPVAGRGSTIALSLAVSNSGAGAGGGSNSSGVGSSCAVASRWMDRVRKHFWPGFLRLFTQIKLARAFAVGNEAYAGRGRIREPEGRGG